MNKNYPLVFAGEVDPAYLYVKNAETAYYINFNPMSRPKPGEESWPVENITKVTGADKVSKAIKDCQTEEEGCDVMAEVPADGSRNFDELISRYGEDYERSKHYDRIRQVSASEVQSHGINREDKTWFVVLKDGKRLTGKYKLNIVQSTSMLNVNAECDSNDAYVASLIGTEIAKEIGDRINGK